VDRIEGHYLAGGSIDWDRVADGSARVLRADGTLEVYFRGANDGAPQFGPGPSKEWLPPSGGRLGRPDHGHEVNQQVTTLLAAKDS